VRPELLPFTLNGPASERMREFQQRRDRKMRTLCAVLMVAVAAALIAPHGAVAQEKKVLVLVVERIQDLDLTDAQETKIKEIRKEFRPKVKDAVKEMETLIQSEVEKIGAVLTPQQKEKLAAHKEERKEHREDCVAHMVANLKELDLTDAENAKIGEIRATFRPKIEKAMETLHGTLTPEQRDTREAALKAGKSHKEIVEALKLTDAQKEKCKTVHKEVHQFVQQEIEAVRDVLSEEQKEKLQDIKSERKERVRDRRAHMVANLKDLALTEDQMTKITEIRKEFRPKVHEAGNKVRALIREEIEDVLRVLKG
jgi:Spy/CpxP family protein refolding chaperone